MLHTKVIHLDNRNRQSGTATNCNFNLDAPVRAKRIIVESVQIPYTWYPINSTNNTFNVNDSTDGPINVVITPGNYTITTLITALLAGLNGGTAGYTMTQHSSTFKLTLTCVRNFIVEADGTLNTVLGYSTAADTANALSHTAINIPNLQFDDYILVNSNLTVDGSMYQANGEQHGVLLKVPVVSNWGTTLFYSNNDNIVYDVNELISNIHLSLTFRDTTLVDLNGGNWSITLKILY